MTGENSTVVKPWYKSKMIWLNVFTFVAGLGPVIGEFSGLIDPVTYSLLLAGVGLANVALRTITNQELTR